MAAGIFYTMGLNTSGFTGALNRALGVMGTAGRGVSGLGAKLMNLTNAFSLAGQAMQAMQAASGPLRLAADMEKTEVGMNTIIKNLQVTKALISELRTLAAKTPLELPDLTGGARTMLGKGWKLGAVVKDLKMLGDVAAGAQAPLSEIVRITTSVKGKEVLQTEELREFAEQGVAGLSEALAQLRGVSTGQLNKDLAKGLLNVNDLMEAFRLMTGQGGIFFNAMADQARTTYGLLSTLRDNVNQVWLAFTRPLNDSFKPLLNDAIERAGELATQAENVVGSWQVAFANGKLGEVLFDQMRMGLAKAGNFAVAIFEGVKGALSGAAEGFDWLFAPKLWQAIGNYLDLGLQKAAVNFVASMAEGLRELNSALPRMLKMDDGVLAAKAAMLRAKGGQTGAMQFNQGLEIARYLHSQNLGASMGKAVENALKGFKEAFNSANKPFDEAPGRVTKDAMTAARILKNNQALADKNAMADATGGSKSMWAHLASLIVSPLKAAAGHLGKSAKATESAAGEMSKASKAMLQAFGMAPDPRQGRIKGYSAEIQGDANAARARAQMRRGGFFAGVDSIVRAGTRGTGSPLDYLTDRSVPPYQRGKTLNERVRAQHVKEEQKKVETMVELLERIASGVEALKPA